MSFVTVNGFDVEHGINLLIYKNFFPQIQHINEKGLTDTYTQVKDIRGKKSIDVLRVLPYVPNFRQVGGANNGGYTNAKNGSYDNAPQTEYYTIDVDLFFDRSFPIPATMAELNPTDFETVVQRNIIDSITLGINAVTYAKQLLGFFRNGDNFDKAKTHEKGSIVANDITEAELAEAIYEYSDGSSTEAIDAFIGANDALRDGVPQIGAYYVEDKNKQAFISRDIDKLLKAQYQENASEASARILATGFINPFNNSESTRVSGATGLVGMYDGVDLFVINKVVRKFMYVTLGISGSDADSATCRAALDKLQGYIAYAYGTMRGMTQIGVEANKDQYNYGTVIIAPMMKMGVECIHGASIKAIVSGKTESAHAWTRSVVALLMNKLEFTCIDGLVNTGYGVVEGFNDGTTH